MLYKIYGCGLRDEFGLINDISQTTATRLHHCFVTADMTSITQNGDLLFLRIEEDGDKTLILALASCEWRSVYECDEDRELLNVGT